MMSWFVSSVLDEPNKTPKSPSRSLFAPRLLVSAMPLDVPFFLFVFNCLVCMRHFCSLDLIKSVRLVLLWRMNCFISRGCAVFFLNSDGYFSATSLL